MTTLPLVQMVVHVSPAINSEACSFESIKAIRVSQDPRNNSHLSHFTCNCQWIREQHAIGQVDVEIFVVKFWRVSARFFVMLHMIIVRLTGLYRLQVLYWEYDCSRSSQACFIQGWKSCEGLTRSAALDHGYRHALFKHVFRNVVCWQTSLR